MNNFYLVFIPLFILQSCSSPKQAQKVEFARTGEVKCTQYDRDVIQLMATSRASTMEEASVFAERNAIENLLFKGIPGSNQESPLVSNELESLRQHPAFYDNFIMQREYEKYIMDSYIASKNEQNKVWIVQQQIEVDLEAMRRHLEQNQIIRKFGL